MGSDPELFAWRDQFTALCTEFAVSPAAVCVQFSFLFPQITSIALNTTKPSRVQSNVDLANAVIPKAFWTRMQREGLSSFAPPAKLRHSVHLQLSPEATAAQKSAMITALKGLPMKIPQIADLTCGLDE